MRFMRRAIVLTAVLLTAPAVSRAADDVDPAAGKFTLKQATAGLSGKGPLTATLDTSKGGITCELFEKQAPNTVANFVGLARGLRPFKDPKTGKWEKRPYYDGLVFHRVIPNFMIQGGDIEGTGRGGPGYSFADEFSPDLKFSKGGQLAMANRGPATNGSQFFITDVPGPQGPPTHLTGRHTIFGQCEPISVISAIANAPAGAANRPQQDVVIKKVTISRGKPAAKK